MLSVFSVNVRLELDSRDVRPGDVLCGVVHVRVRDTVNITAVRVRITGTESGYARVRVGSRTTRVSFDKAYFDSLITLFGYSKASGRRGGVTLSEGAYEYPFRCALPPTTPPSYRCSIGMASGSLSYVVKAYVDIPNSFDAKTEQPFVVWPSAPLWQLQQARVQCYAVPPISAVAYMESGVCCKGKSKPVQVSVQVSPTVLVLEGGGGDADDDNDNNNNSRSSGGGDDAAAAAAAVSTSVGGNASGAATRVGNGHDANASMDCAACTAQDDGYGNNRSRNNGGNNSSSDPVVCAAHTSSATSTSALATTVTAATRTATRAPLPSGLSSTPLNVLTVAVTLRNVARTHVRTVTATLKWHAVFRVRDVVVDGAKTICKRAAPVPLDRLQQDGSTVVRIDLPLGDALRVDTRTSNKRACATLRTATVEVYTKLTVVVGGVDMDDVKIDGIVQLTSRVDATNRVPASPVHYTQTYLLPENVDLAS